MCAVTSHSFISSHQQQGAASLIQGLSLDEEGHDGQARRREVPQRAERRQGDPLHTREHARERAEKCVCCAG